MNNNAPQPFSYLKSKTAIQPTNNSEIFPKETSVFKKHITGKDQADTDESQTATPLPVNEERTNSGTLPAERKHPTTIDDELLSSAFSTFL